MTLWLKQNKAWQNEGVYLIVAYSVTIFNVTRICYVSLSYNQGLSWWCHQMETGPLCGEFTGCRNSPVTGEFPTQRPVTRRFDVFFDLRLNKRLSKQSWGWWLETPSRSSWRHCNERGWLAHRNKSSWVIIPTAAPNRMMHKGLNEMVDIL